LAEELVVAYHNCVSGKRVTESVVASSGAEASKKLGSQQLLQAKFKPYTLPIVQKEFICLEQKK